MIMMNSYSPYSRSVRRSGFTLIELLVVIALTVILLGLIFTPLIQAFNFTQQAQATAQAQDAARSTTEELTRELTSAAGVRDTTNNFLDLPLVSNTGQEVTAHAYNAYIDIIPPRAALGTIIDPTVDRFVPTVNPGETGITGTNQELGGSGVILPLAAGSTVIRYFVGLRYPIDPQYAPTSATVDPGNGQYAESQPYTNRYEGLNIAKTDSPWSSSYVAKQNLNNTYQLYRVNFQPYVQYEPGITYNGTTPPSYGSYVPNANILPTTSNGTVPVYDDPDFFRIVAVGQNDYVAGQGDGGMYNATTAEAHNWRTYNWYKIAKEVISTREIDLAGLTRSGNKVTFDKNGNPVDSYESDGTTPIVRTTISFAPALISNDPMAATNSNNASQGYGTVPPTQETNLPYVPSEFAAEYGNWQGTPAVTLAKTTTTGSSYFQTGTFRGATSYSLGSPNYSSTGATTVTDGDLVLFPVSSTGAVQMTPVYDITAEAPVLATGSTLPTAYDALILNDNSGTVSFAIPALPPLLAGQSAAQIPPDPYWYYKSESTGTVNLVNDIETSMYATSPAPVSPLAGSATVGGVPNSQMVVNSERVIGPDESAGIAGSSTANTTDLVQYTRVNPADISGSGPGPNQYTVNYQNGTLQTDAAYAPLQLQIAYQYQNNVGTNGSSNTVDTIRASYYTAAMMRLNLGIRVYGASTGVSDYFSLNSQVGVSNSKAN